MTPNRWPMLIVASVFGLCVAIVTVGFLHPEAAQSILQLLILAGLVIGFIDRHLKQQEAVQKIDQNTTITSKAEEKINGRLEQLIQTARQAAFAEGLLAGQEKERRRQGEQP